MKFILPIVFALSLFNISIAQQSSNLSETDSFPREKEIVDFWGFRDTVVSTIDTSLSSFHNHFSNYPDFRVGLGGIGHASYSLTPSISNDYLRFSRSYFGDFEEPNPEMKILLLNQPFTEAKFISIGNSEQFLDLVHSQKVRKDWHVGLGFKLLGSQNFYSRQNTRFANFYINSSYKSLNKPYRLDVQYSLNRFKYEENGGIADDSTFSDPSTFNRAGLTTNILEGEQLHRRMGLKVRQYYGLRKGQIRKDSTSLDSIFFDEGIKLVHSLNAFRTGSSFVDFQPDSATYLPLFAYEDSVGVLDTSRYFRVENRVGIRGEFGFGGGLFENLGFELGLGHQFLDLWQNNRGQTENNILFYWNLKRRFNRWEFLFAGDRVLSGYNSGDYFFNTRIRREFSSKWISFFSASTQLQSRRPDLVFDRYQNDFFNWDIGASTLQAIKTEISASSKQLKSSVTLSYSLIDGLFYFDSLAMPAQISGQVDHIAFDFRKGFKLGIFHWDTRLLWQNVSGEQVIRVPDFTTFNSFYVEGKLFKKVMLLRVGLDVFYHTKYKAPAWMPVTRQFYLQEETEVGDYPIVDAFLAFRVKKARIFLKASHVNEGLFGFDYYFLPNYPIHGRVFRFGISWKFYN